ncbi:DUF3817 domain-containing protein [Devosia sp. RR2S18]|uniref:DUF3817 domain-containing protein n=1 Tax=Devosia rhizosphaerae TaxID=3049774 RepID=UPI0032EC4703
MIRAFRYIGVLEGITTVALFFVAMPAKYVFGYPQLVPTVGLVHGIAFVVYLLAMMSMLPGQGLTAGQWARRSWPPLSPWAHSSTTRCSSASKWPRRRRSRLADGDNLLVAHPARHDGEGDGKPV